MIWNKHNEARQGMPQPNPVFLAKSATAHT